MISGAKRGSGVVYRRYKSVVSRTDSPPQCAPPSEEVKNANNVTDLDEKADSLLLLVC